MSKIATKLKTEQYNFVTNFKCLANECPDTCCRNWDMDVDVNTKTMYDLIYPNLKSLVTIKDNRYLIAKNKETGTCIKYNNGLCEVHQKYGENALGDACHFYPRIIFKAADKSFVSASLSCPEITRIIFFGKNNNIMRQKTHFLERVPLGNRNYAPSNVIGNYFIKIHKTFLKITENEEFSLIKIFNIAEKLVNLSPPKWHDNILALKQLASEENNLKKPDPYNKARLVQMFLLIFKSTGEQINNKIYHYFSRVEQFLAIQINYNNTEVNCLDDLQFKLSDKVNSEQADYIENILQKWLKIQLINSFFPYAGLGKNIIEKLEFISAKYLINRIFLYSTIFFCKNHQEREQQISEVIYLLARQLDHLADLNLFQAIKNDYGWQDSKIFKEMVVTL